MSPAAQDAGLDLSVVIPAFNESGRIGATLRTVAAYLASQGWAAEIVVVDDGSTDDTAALAGSILEPAGLAYQVLTGRPNRGKGYSVREGALAARHGWILVSDADLSTPIGEVEKLWAAATAGGHPLVVGSRALPGSRIGVRQNWIRMNMGRTFNRIVRLLTGLEIRDTQCGFKLWHGATLRPVLERLRVDGFAWDVELLMAARRAGISMAEVPVEWNDRTGSKVGMLRDSTRMLIDVVRIRLGR